MVCTRRRTALRILVGGRIAAAPYQAGAAWAVLQWLLGCSALGHEVWFAEPLPLDRISPTRSDLTTSENARFLRAVLEPFGLERRACLFVAETGETVGLDRAALSRVIRDVDVLIDISGVLAGVDGTERIPVRLYLDVDPAFTQLWHARGVDVGLYGHTHHASVGSLLSMGPTALPDCGVRWLPVLPPVVLGQWPAAPPAPSGAFTTILNWRSYGSIEDDGRIFGQKAHALRPLAALPARVQERFELALAIDLADAADLDLLESSGWQTVDPVTTTGSLDAYRSFIAGSKAEIGIAKTGYSLIPTGWFSDRSACYLASARPVVAQATGFERILPTGVGLLSFDGLDSAVAAISEVSADYERHVMAARGLAEEYLASGRVIGDLLRRIGMVG